MAEAQLWAAAFVAFVAWFAAMVMARLRSIELSSSFAKALCWIAPALGVIALIALLYEGYFGEAGGYRGFAMGLLSLLFYALAPAILLGQVIFGAIARKADTDAG